MDKTELLGQVTQIIRKISANSSLEVNELTRFDEIDDWDSLNTVDMEMELESTFDISFATGEFRELETIGELLNCLSQKFN